ncbi:saccharopine dehydrogenase [Nocardiopsis exhalans]|uniref:Saccharopine dehydrogenase n=1 Tax=Nocardiopsis exhalans TaxID=163604 RepID=A0ABY5CZ73_9ACTN|nr:saccharopine dehydrogenase [Nocardiopsis exhalans]USY17074.1 saccharopine dehydrogenase [Nocardiopsis exhalans]
MRVLVLGGYGAVGAPTVAALREAGHSCVVAGRDPRRAERVVDLAEPGLLGYQEALNGVDAVVNASGAEDPDLVTAATGQGAAFVDPTATPGYVSRIEQLEPRAPVLLSVGLAPGLTNLLAADLPGKEPIELGVVLGSGERHGAAATAWSLGLLGRSFADPATGEAVRNLTRGRVLDMPGGRRRLFRADFSDQHTLTRDLGRPVRTYLGLDSAAATRVLSLLARLPGAGALRGVRRVPHLPGSEEWVLVATSAGRRRWARGRNQSRGTAVVTAWAAGLTEGLPAGVHHLHEVAALADLPPLEEATLG